MDTVLLGDTSERTILNVMDVVVETVKCVVGGVVSEDMFEEGKRNLDESLMWCRRKRKEGDSRKTRINLNKRVQSRACHTMSVTVALARPRCHNQRGSFSKIASLYETRGKDFQYTDRQDFQFVGRYKCD